uniref:Uncharacterized protein n=1 Tax=Corethron hystrix TaxID=216773 RepID=A0A6U5FJD9_9STRA
MFLRPDTRPRRNAGPGPGSFRKPQRRTIRRKFPGLRPGNGRPSGAAFVGSIRRTQPARRHLSLSGRGPSRSDARWSCFVGTVVLEIGARLSLTPVQKNASRRRRTTSDDSLSVGEDRAVETKSMGLIDTFPIAAAALSFSWALTT